LTLQMQDGQDRDAFEQALSLYGTRCAMTGWALAKKLASDPYFALEADAKDEVIRLWKERELATHE
jgi:hypothetical protein